MMRPLRYLLVEDSEDDAILIAEQLRSSGYRPDYLQVYTREGMLAALGDETWDVVISDHNLPSFSATEALGLLIESGRDIPFIIVSGAIGEDLAVEAMKAGAHDFIMKQSLAKLPPAVDNAIRAAEERRLHRQAQGDLAESREQLRGLASHLATVREEEKAHLAREIHDELGGTLTALKMDIAWLARHCEGQEGALEKLHTMTSLADGAVKTLRRIITDLRPSILDDLGLIAAIEWQFDEFRRRSGLRTALVLGTDPDVAETHFPSERATAVFRIFQESLTNIARHARALSVQVRAWIDGGGFHLEVADDGCGLGEGRAGRRNSHGILGMRERAYQIGAELSVGPADGGGTRVALVMPLAAAGTGLDEGE